jgi:hypothetical protein
MLIIPQINLIILNGKKGGLIKLLLEAVQKHNLKVRLVVAEHSSTDTILKKKKGRQNIDIKFIVPANIKEAATTTASDDNYGNTKSLLLIVDRATAVVIAAKQIQNSSSSTASSIPADIVIESYSICTNKADVLSHVTTFEILWKQIELYEDIKKAHEQLKNHDRMQEKFLSVAAHELLTPIQPIIFMSDILLLKVKDSEQRELLEVINRNAKILQHLATDKRHVTRIESNLE